MNALALHELADIMEGAWNGSHRMQSRKPVLFKKRGWKVRMGPAKEPTMLFDRRRRITLLFELFLIALFALLLYVLVTGSLK